MSQYYIKNFHTSVRFGSSCARHNFGAINAAFIVSCRHWNFSFIEFHGYDVVIVCKEEKSTM